MSILVMNNITWVSWNAFQSGNFFSKKHYFKRKFGYNWTWILTDMNIPCLRPSWKWKVVFCFSHSLWQDAWCVMPVVRLNLGVLTVSCQTLWKGSDLSALGTQEDPSGSQWVAAFILWCSNCSSSTVFLVYLSAAMLLSNCVWILFRAWWKKCV